jgi:hypothetical protein
LPCHSDVPCPGQNGSNVAAAVSDSAHRVSHARSRLGNGRQRSGRRSQMMSPRLFGPIRLHTQSGTSLARRLTRRCAKLRYRKRKTSVQSTVETDEVMRQPRDSRTDLVSWSLPLSGEPLSRLSVSTNLEKVAAAVLAGISGRPRIRAKIYRYE